MMESWSKVPPRTVIASRVAALWLIIVAGSLAVAEDRPNILWISAEDTTLEYGCYGDEYAITPTIDRLATNGIRFSNCFAESPMCAPSRFTLITGIHTGPMGTSCMRSAHRIPEYVTGFPAYLRKAGYYCTNNQKTDYNTLAQSRITRESWDDSGPNAHWSNRQPGQPFFAVFNYEKTHQSWDSQLPFDTFRATVQSGLRPDQIHDPAKAPLPPYYPDTSTARRTIARYYDCISSLDDFVNARLAELDEHGVAEDTIVIFFADNGGGIPRSKATPFESGLREPLIVLLPRRYQHQSLISSGSIDDRLVSFADFAPTMLSLAGVDIPASMQGHPFLGPKVLDPVTFLVGTRDRLDETLEVTRWLNDGRYHYIRSFRTHVPFDQQTLIAFYNGGAELVQTDAGPQWAPTMGGGELCWEIRARKAAGKLTDLQEEFWGDSRPAEALYDSKADPWNINNLADLPEYQQQLKTMRQQLRRSILENRDLGFWPEPDLADAEKRGVPFDLAKDDAIYPLERILETTELSPASTEGLAKLRQRLCDDNSTVRYWAAVALHSAPSANKEVVSDLKVAMLDRSASVRIEAAWALAEIRGDDVELALALLAKELNSPNEYAACRAAHALQMLGDKARPYLATIKQAASKPIRNRNYAFQHSLLRALQNFADRP